jgi:probable rRNA maturation factor
MIFIHTKLRAQVVDKKQLHDDLALLLQDLGYADFDINVVLTTNATIRRYNRDYRHKDKPTDILSFPYHPDLKPGQRIKVKDEEDKNLGDLIISVEYVRRAAQELGVTFENRLKRLLVHGVCHLLGYDHIKDTDYQIMLKKEIALLKKISTAPIDESVL